jgi:hypothetical protein
MKIIALGHKKRQFKDRFAQVLRENLRALRRTGKSGVNTYALITPVKSAATRMFGIYNIDAIDKDGDAGSGHDATSGLDHVGK